MIEPSIVYLDSHLLVLNKPNGMVTQPTSESLTSLEEWGKAWLKKEFHKPGNVFLEALFRLDKPASGIVLFARTSKAISRLQEKMREGQLKKKYLALVEGHLVKKEDCLEDYLIHDDFRAILGRKDDRSSKFASLHYKVLKENEGMTLVEIELHTGRYHQIRFQFSKRGHPLLGDQKYGSGRKFKEGAIALHHFKLEAPHPIGGELLKWEVPPPWN